MSSTTARRIQVRRRFDLGRGKSGRRVLESPSETEAPSATPAGRIPRISRLMALAIRFDQLLRDGVVADYAELAHLSHVSRARITQIMNLLNLAPDIQEAILFLPRVQSGRDPIREHVVRPITAIPDWRKQRRMFQPIARMSHYT